MTNLHSLYLDGYSLGSTLFWSFYQKAGGDRIKTKRYVDSYILHIGNGRSPDPVLYAWDQGRIAGLLSELPMTVSEELEAGLNDLMALSNSLHPTPIRAS